MTRKSTIAITRVRTGKGDKGETTLGGRHLRKYHPLVTLTGQLDLVQAHTDALPTQWIGEISPRNIAQELLFRLGAAIAGSEQFVAISQITELLEIQLTGMTEGLKPLDSFIRCGAANQHMHKLRAHVRRAECLCVEVHDTRMDEGAPDEELDKFKSCMKALNVMSDWVFAFVWSYSLQDENVVDETLRWKPWSDTTIHKLNT